MPRCKGFRASETCFKKAGGDEEGDEVEDEEKEEDSDDEEEYDDDDDDDDDDATIWRSWSASSKLIAPLEVILLSVKCNFSSERRRGRQNASSCAPASPTL